jgi:beta-glucosidase
MDCGEGIDSASLTLPGVQLELLRALKARGVRVITVLVGGRPYAMQEIEENSDAILCAFYPGPLGGKVLPRLLFGDVAPAGRLPVSLPETVGTLPVFYNYKQSYRAMKYYDSPAPTRYPFGFGLTYTHFSYALEQAPDGKNLTVCFTVKNEGTCASYAVPQLYLRRMSGEVTSRIRELCGFEKVCLAPGEAKTVSIAIPEDSLRQWDLSMHHTLVPGKFEWYLGDMGKEDLHGAFEI